MSRREDGRLDDELRPVVITRGFTSHPAGSVLVEFGQTRVMCTASVTEGVPRWRKGSGQGWLTAEYAMLPAATHERSDRESVKGRVGGRTQEISRLIGRSLRACIDLAALGENTIAIDCDVLQADGGTRTAAITGAYVALADAVTWLAAGGKLADPRPLSCAIAAVSVGVVDGRVRARPALHGGLAGRGGHERRRHRHRHARRGPGHRRGRDVPAARRWTSCSTPRSPACDQLFVIQQEALELPYPGELPESDAPRRRRSEADRVLLVASRNRKKLAELRRVLDAAGISGLTLLSLDDVAAFDEAPETGCDVRGERVGQGARRVRWRPGCPASPTTRGSRSTR